MNGSGFLPIGTGLGGQRSYYCQEIFITEAVVVEAVVVEAVVMEGSLL
jgi:hypothetical protein